MQIPVLRSIRPVDRQYNTGEEPVLVLCSDKNSYVCKYMRSSASSYKLACELAGSLLSQAWGIDTPRIAFVHICSKHWSAIMSPHSISAPTLGSLRLEGVADVMPSTYREIKPTMDLLVQLIRIALFDFWVANEDRNANNANLLYDINHQRLVSIDYGCIFNTATFDYPMSQLTSTDTILWSDLFQHLLTGTSHIQIEEVSSNLRHEYVSNVRRCLKAQKYVLSVLPKEWNVPNDAMARKMSRLFEKQWIGDVWDNFIENIKANSNG